MITSLSTTELHKQLSTCERETKKDLAMRNNLRKSFKGIGKHLAHLERTKKDISRELERRDAKIAV